MLTQHAGTTIAIGTHGIALATILNHYNPAFGYDDFMAMAFLFPWIVKMTFDGNKLVSMEKFDVTR